MRDVQPGRVHGAGQQDGRGMTTADAAEREAEYEERAAILEYDAGMNRIMAEMLARRHVRKVFPEVKEEVQP